MSDFLLSVELSKDQDHLMIHGDEKGLRQLCKSLERLIANTKTGHFNHDHLMTPEWGGRELTSECQGKAQGDRLLHSVKVYCWKGNKQQL